GHQFDETLPRVGCPEPCSPGCPNPEPHPSEYPIPNTQYLTPNTPTGGGHQMAQQRPELSATPRATGRKAILSALRREGKIPAVVYGHGDPSAIAFDGREVSDFLRHHAASALIDLKVNGD